MSSDDAAHLARLLKNRGSGASRLNEKVKAFANGL